MRPFFITVALALLLTSCASKPSRPNGVNDAVMTEVEACLGIRLTHQYAAATHVNHRGWTPEFAAKVAERFLAAVDPYELLLADAERVALRGAALVIDPELVPASCGPLMAAAKSLGRMREHLQTVILEGLTMPDAKGIRTVALPRGTHKTPAQRDASLIAAMRHYRALLLAAGYPSVDASALVLVWFQDWLKRVETPTALYREYQQALLRSLPGENAYLPDVYAQLEAIGEEDALVRALRHDWVPEVGDLSGMGLARRGSGLRPGDRVLGIELENDGHRSLISWIGQGPTYAGHLLPLAPATVAPYRYVVLRKDDSGSYRGVRIDGARFGPQFETIAAKGHSILFVDATAFDSVFVKRLADELVEKSPEALVLDLRAATFPADTMVEVLAGVFSHDTVWGYLHAKKLWQERRSLGLPPRWNGPVVLVVGPNTRGPAESLAAGLKSIGRAIVLGATKTSGQGGGSFSTDLKNGRHLLMTLARRFDARGNPIDGIGVTPDILVGPKPERLPPRFGTGEPIAGDVPSDAPWKKNPNRRIASSIPSELKKIATMAAQDGGEDPVASAAIAVAAELVLQRGKR